MNLALSRPPIPVIVQQHAEESAHLRHVRSVLVRAPHVKLHQLRRLDDRIAAHLDGLLVAGEFGAGLCREALERPGAGEVFASAALALERRDGATLERLLALAAVLPDAKRGLLSALGWVSAESLKGVVGPMLVSAQAVHRELGLGACRLQGVDPGPAAASALRDADAAVRVAGLRVAGELGRLDLLEAARDAIADDDIRVRQAAAVAATLLGDRGAALQVLADIGFADAPGVNAVQALAVQAAELEQARRWVRSLNKPAPGGGPARAFVRACGVLGDAQAVPWLIGLMGDDALARLAGESFTMITGADLAALDLERKPPQDLATGPNDKPDDDDVALDEDDSLPWPEPGRVQAWWQAHALQMPAGVRLFMGRPPTQEHALNVLRTGMQRQRIAAARWACLLAPGTKCFATAAPAWRQQRRLEKTAG